MRFEGKVVVVTGGSRGIGRATALEFAKEGAGVIVVYNKAADEADKVVDAIKKMGRKAQAIKCDVAHENEVKAMVDKAINSFKHVDILVNNAGIVIDTPFKNRTVEHWKKTLDVNLIGSFLCAKYLGPLMVKQKYGQIVNVSSNNAFGGWGGDSIDYDASKAGMVIMTKDLAVEFGPYVRVNSLAPGWVDTDMNKDLSKEFMAKEAERAALKRNAKPEEMARIILFLASDDASYIDGQTIIADGYYK